MSSILQLGEIVDSSVRGIDQKGVFIYKKPKKKLAVSLITGYPDDNRTNKVMLRVYHEKAK